MVEDLNLRQGRIISSGRVIPEIEIKKNNIAEGKDSPSFSEILKTEISKDNMKFSAHAVKRMEERSIYLSDKEIGALNNAVKKASEKGIKDSLVVMKDVALIVNIPNKTVITAIEGSSLKENVFTNIDGAVFV